MQLRDQKNTWPFRRTTYVYEWPPPKCCISAFTAAFQHQMQLKRVSTTRWNSTESAVEPVLGRYSETLATLTELAESPGSDSETLTSALGLHKRLKDIRFIICMEILKTIYSVIGPVSRLLQGSSIDLASAAVLLEDCVSQFATLRMNADSTWKAIYERSVVFAKAHDVNTEFPSERRKATKKMPGEMAADECASGLDRFKTETLITVLDEAYQQMCSRFQQQNLAFMQQLSLFTPKSLISEKSVTSLESQNICQLYGVDANAVAAELSDFKKAFRLLSQSINGTGNFPFPQAGHDAD